MTIEKITDIILTTLVLIALAILGYFILDALPGAVDHMLTNY